MKKFLFFIMLLASTSLYSQIIEGNFEILTMKGELIKAKKVRSGKNYLDFETTDGKAHRLTDNKIFGFREVPENLPELKLNGASFEPIVVKVEGKSASDLYNAAQIWVQKYYKNPGEVLKSDIPNKSIRIEGYNGAMCMMKSMMRIIFGSTYTIELGFKDGRYRLIFYPGEISNSSSVKSYPLSMYLKKDGTIQPGYKFMFQTYEFNANKISADIYKYLTGEVQEQEDDW